MSILTNESHQKFLGGRPELHRHHWPCGLWVRIRLHWSLEPVNASFGIPVPYAAHDMHCVSCINPCETALNQFLLYSQGIKSLVFVSMLYGIFSGACRYRLLDICLFYHFLFDTGLSLLVTALSTLASRMSETGYVIIHRFPKKNLRSSQSVFRTRIGLVLSISSFGLLFSALIQDGTLTPNHIWVIPSAISGVSLHLRVIYLCVTLIFFRVLWVRRSCSSV